MKSTVALLLALIWLPLAGYVMFRPALGAARALRAAAGHSRGDPAVHPRAAIAGAARWVALFGVTPGVLLAADGGDGAVSAARGSEQAAGALCRAGRRSEHGVLFLLGSDMRGRDMLSRTLWGCQRVLVWGITATSVAYVVGAGCRADRRLSRRLVG